MRKLAIFSIGFAVAAAVYIRLLSPLMGLIAAGGLLAAVFVTILFHGDPAKRVRIAALGAAVGLLWTWGYEQIKLRPNVLVASITRGTTSQVPGGDSVFRPGDTVVIVTSGRGVLNTMNDIFA